jgi:hypothetical protein
MTERCGFRGVACLVAMAWLTSRPLGSQTPTSATNTIHTPSEWKVPRTPWGHPDLQGVWTTDAEVSVPLERPKEFGNRAFMTAAELADRAALEKKLARDDPNDRDPFRLGPVGDGPEHWFEWAAHPSARTSLIVDPPDGRIPPWTPDAQKRPVDRRRVVGYGEPAGRSTTTDFRSCKARRLSPSCMSVCTRPVSFPWTDVRT